MQLRFGTDGVRGRAFTELTERGVTALGRAAVDVFGPQAFFVGRDTRQSGPALSAALAAGLAAGGASIIDVGVAPTPAIAWLAAADGRPGAVISASHNPYEDNGIKLFAPGGRKLSDRQQDAVQERLVAYLDAPIAANGVMTEVIEGESHTQRWADAVQTSLDGRNLDGLHVVIDCANGASSATASTVLQALGARVDVIFDAPDGVNINAGCGSRHPQALQAAVRDLGADAGLAFDGDADRVLAVDASGELIDGDHILAICARDLRDRNKLRHDTVVVTVMTNLGFRLAMADAGISVVDTAVGDRYVLEALEVGGYSLGGEQSGHVIFRELASTGDGLLTGVQLLDIMRRRREPLGSLASASMTRLPQVLRNVRIERANPTLLAALVPEIERVEQRLGSSGRVLVRASGTEPLIRVMVEALDEHDALTATEELVDAVGRLARDAHSA